MSTSHRFLKFCRSIHLYLGVFTAPALLFFAITGGLQTFSLHETTRGSTYQPPALLATLALMHKKQTIVAPPKRPRPADSVAPAPAGMANPSEAKALPDVDAGSKSGGQDHEGAHPKKNLLPMKLFFALVAVSLVLSTLTGIYMSYRYSRRPRLVSSILLAGVLVPLALLWI